MPRTSRHVGHGLRGRHLRFPQDKLYGRKDELGQLWSVYKNLRERKDKDGTSVAEMVLVAGYSGTGKSSLVYKFRDLLNTRTARENESDLPPYWFVSGVFETGKTDPLSAIMEAFNSSCVQLINSDNKKEIHRVADGIRKTVGKEGKALTDMIPQLTRLIGKQPDASTSSTNSNSLNRLKFHFLSFVEIICCGERPLVLFLDDLQRADTASIDLMSTLMTAPGLGNKLMLIGSFRCNEVNETHPLQVALKTMEQRRKIESEIVEVSNLAVEAMNQFISDTLQLEAEETLSLTYAVYHKTEGNIFYTIQSLEQLNEQQVLRYDYTAAFRWVWDIEKINQGMDLADNVVDIVTARIRNLPLPLQRILSIAAFTRKSFDLHTIEGFIEMQYGQASVHEFTYYDYGLVELLDMAVDQGLLESPALGSSLYRFSHDRVQQAASSHAPENQKLREQVGKYLAKLVCTGGGEDWMMFVAADHLNAAMFPGGTGTSEELEALAKLNLAVGKKAVSLSAFVPACSYYRLGLEALSKLSAAPWQSHYELALELHRAVSHSELSIGDFNFGWNIAHQLLDNAVNLQEKLPTYMSLADALRCQTRDAEAVELLVESLELLCECPKKCRLYHVLKDFLFVKREFRQRSDSDIVGLPLMTDPNKLGAMELFFKLTIAAFDTHNTVLFALANLRPIRFAFKSGLCDSTAAAFGAYGVLLCERLQDSHGARRMAKLSREVLEVTNGSRFKGMVLYAMALCIDPWFVPLSAVMETFHTAHLSGMEMGDFEAGFRSFFQSQVMAYAAGTPLSQIEKNEKRLLQLIDQYNVDTINEANGQFQVLVGTLTGSRIQGDWREPYPTEYETRFGRMWYYFTRMQLAYFFDELSLADEMCTVTTDLVDGFRVYVFISHTLLFASLITMKKLLQTGRRKYWTRARKLRKEFKRVTKARGFNTLHKYYIMEAQYLALLPGRKKEEKVRAAFDKAISASSKAGFTQDSAIANELAGEFFLRVNDRFWARHYLNHAYQEYNYWKAHAKADQLIKKYGGLIDNSVNPYNSTSFVRTKRIQGEACEKHKSINLEALSGGTVPLSDESFRGSLSTPASQTLPSV